ncbi:MAG: hypothetical protein IT428_18905 [Planctomycetaceae bacterium]|nr:hypothetical protein [Planctomycetaceae bacterium]
MSEIIEFACDICGQKYRYSEERMGRKTDCRECGAPFELNKHTIAKDDDEEDSDDEEVSPWILIRSAVVGTLLFFIIGGLSYLPFYAPEPRSLMASTTPPGRLGNPPSGFPQPGLPGHGFPHHNPGFSPAGVPNGGMPGNNAVWPPPRTNRNVTAGSNDARGDSGGNPRPDEDATRDTELAAGTGPKTVPQPIDVPRPDATKPDSGKPVEPKPEKTATSDSRGPDMDDDPGEIPAELKKLPYVRSVSIGKLNGRDNHIVVKGANLTKVKQLLPIYDPYWPLSEQQFTAVSNTQIDTQAVTFAGGYKPIGVLLGSAEGLTVAIPEDSVRVNRDESIDSADKAPVIVVERGGSLTSDARAVIVVEQGGTVNVRAPFGFYVALKGATLRTEFPLHKSYMATGAKYESKFRTGFTPERIPTIRVIKLKSGSSNE